MKPFEPLFIDGSAGRLYLIHHRPSGAELGSCVVVVPAFAEEMNKSRRQVALQARALSENGFGVAIADLFGTGESDGNFEDARIEHWAADLDHICEWARLQGYASIRLLAVRSGALLVAPLLSINSQAIDRLALWQPQCDGKLCMNQFLRLKVAAGMIAGGNGGGIKDLRANLSAGLTVEVAGYALHPEFVDEFDALNFVAIAGTASLPIDWIDLGGTDGRVSPVARRVMESLANAGCDVHHHVCVGDPFWATAEIATVPELITLTCTLLAGDK